VAANAVLILLPALIILWLATQVRQRRIQMKNVKDFLPLGVFLAVATVSWIWGNIDWDVRFPQPPDLMAVQAAQWSIFFLSVAAFIWGAQQSPRVLRQLTWLFIGLGILALLGRYGGALRPPGFYALFADRAVTNGNFFVLLTALAGGQALFNGDLSSRRRAGLLALALAVPLLGIWQNQQWATSWVPPIVVLLFLFWWRVHSRLVTVVLIVLALLLLVLTYSSLSLTLLPQSEQISVDGRFILWESIIRLSLERPILGLGLTTYRHYHHYIPLLTPGGGQWYTPSVNSHNNILTFFHKWEFWAFWLFPGLWRP
jgi:hypothetical protein